jgi:hypothetical protein
MKKVFRSKSESQVVPVEAMKAQRGGWTPRPGRFTRGKEPR